MKRQSLLLSTGIIAAVALSGCAGSAAHKVVTANQAGDHIMTCDAIDTEIIKTQAIIDGVNRDKDDVSGADVVDGVLWFPFNLVAKHQNYNDALEAADRRIARLNELKSEKQCGATSAELVKSLEPAIAELGELAKLYKEGAISEAEYKEAKQKLLDKL